MRTDVDGLHVEIELVVEFENIRYIDIDIDIDINFYIQLFVSVTKGGFNPLLVDSEIDVKSAS